LVQLDQLGVYLESLEPAAQMCCDFVGCGRGTGLESPSHRTQRPHDVAMPRVYAGSGGFETRRGKPVASLGTDERCEQDQVDVQIVSVL
jgi:hypothetical protein